jgi:hypothetical protein
MNDIHNMDTITEMDMNIIQEIGTIVDINAIDTIT